MPKTESNNTTEILFVVNPISGNTDKAELKRRIADFMSEQSRQVSFYFTSGKNDEQEITDYLDKNDVKTAVAVGGDGTCNMLAKTLLNREVKMGIIPSGSANGLATELELPNDLLENLRIIMSGNSKKTDVLQINHKHISLHLSDLGFNARLIENFEKSEIRGFVGYTKSFLDEFGKAKPAKFEININNKLYKKKAFMIVIANASKYGTGAIINPKGKTNDGRFEIVVLEAQKFVHFLELIVPFYTRKIHTLDFVDIYTCRKAVIKNLEGQSLQIDGENFGQPEEVTVEILPRSLEVIVP